ncbi:MAG TPA: PQQ-dependent sugar dehydrogenase [Caldilineaceae bacterium]|nr:PQQ-dependent sugar dehydrogenase [Caldilineaceae bacterium]
MLLSSQHASRRLSFLSTFTFLTLILLLALALALRALAAPLHIAAGGPTLQLQEFATGLNQPLKITNAGDSRLFVVEKRGTIRIVTPGGLVLETPFLDIQSRVNNSGNEQGLLGLVFEPGNPNIFYVNYTLELSNPNDKRNGNTIIARYRVSAADPNVADPASEEVILEVAQPAANHNAGDLAFGPDKMLYIPLGDGGGGGDPEENAQNLSRLLGKLLRLDVIGQATYAIPADNPYANDGNPDTRDEIWASGLRNPWRISFDRQTHDLYIGDVGQNEWEEIDRQPSDSAGGENYGWDCYEGNHEYELTDCNASYTDPIFEYSHAENQNAGAGCSSITGGYVYRGTTFPDLQGHYLLADFCSGKFWSLRRDAQGAWQVNAHGKLIDSPSSFGEDVNGELFVASFNGTIYRVRTPLNLPEKLYLPIVNKDGTN